MDPFASALELAGALRNRELSAVEALDASLARVDALDPELNAIVWRDDENARAAARCADEALARGDEGALLGVPVPIKDLTAAAGQPLTFGSHGAPDTPATEDELVVGALRRAGAVLACRTNTPEFGPITVTENVRYGITRNPWATGRTPGGSSGGAAAAVASGMFALAHANDGGGSIRIPASCCGLVGLKASRGRVPRLAQSWLGAVVEGAVTRTVADAATVLEVISGPDEAAWYNAPVGPRPFADEVGADPGERRIGVMEIPPLGLPSDPETAEAVRVTARALEALGHHVEPIEVMTVSEALIAPFTVMTAGGLGDYDGVDWSKVEPHIAHDRRRGNTVGAYDYVVAARALERHSRELVAPWLDGRIDVLLTPTIAIVPPPADSVLEAVHAQPDAPALPVVQMVAFCAFANVTGQPAISVPTHTTAEGVPVGAQLVGRPFDEATLIRLAAQLEQALPWADRRPPG